jgi:hypothetical protein
MNELELAGYQFTSELHSNVGVILPPRTLTESKQVYLAACTIMGPYPLNWLESSSQAFPFSQLSFTRDVLTGGQLGSGHGKVTCYIRMVPMILLNIMIVYKLRCRILEQESDNQNTELFQPVSLLGQMKSPIIACDQCGSLLSWVEKNIHISNTEGLPSI